MDHAKVKVGEYIIPLIGIPPEAGLEECDSCGKVFPLWEIRFNGREYLCENCMKIQKPR